MTRKRFSIFGEKDILNIFLCLKDITMFSRYQVVDILYRISALFKLYVIYYVISYIRQ